MESNPNSADDSYDYLIAFLVVIGALAFIISESFPSSQTSSKKNIPIAATQIKSKKPAFSVKKKTTVTYYQKKQAEKRLEEEGLRKWTEQLEQQKIRNTPYRIPRETAPMAAAALPTVATAQKDTLTTTTKITSTPKKAIEEEPLTGTTVVKEKPIFIDTDTKSQEKVNAESNNLTATANTQKESPKPEPPKATSPAPSRTEKVPNYENQSPKIVVDEVKPKAYNNLTTKSPAPTKEADGPSCVIMIAALKDKANINRLIQSLKKEEYEVYNKISGKYRTVGVRTSCDPAINKPVLREIKKKYSDSAFLLKR